jgi:hypothetical protein
LLAIATERGHASELSPDRHAARQRLIQGGFDGVVVDVERVAGDGLSVLAMVRRFAPRAWIVALLPPAADPTRALAYGIALRKPVRPEVVLESLTLPRS